MTNFVDKVEALKKKARTKWVLYSYEGYSPCEMPCDLEGDYPEDTQVTVEAAAFDEALELLRDKALEAERLQAEIARLKGDR